MLGNPVTTVKGVGPTLASKLALLGCNTVGDLLYFFPRRYDDFSQVTPIAQLAPGKVTIKAKVESVVGRHIRRGLHITEAVLADDTAKTKAVWFNQPYRATQLAKGDEYFFSGTYDLQRNRYVLQNPAGELAKNIGVNTARIVPIYREIVGLKSHAIRKIMHELLPLMSMLPETLPPKLIERQKLPSINDTLKAIHFPETAQQLNAAKNRVSFEEIFTLMLASVLNKRDIASLKAWSIPFSPEIAKTFTAALPFTMTDAQRQAAWEICQDIAKPTPMNRLLQGDVGSGKTVVAAMAAYMAAKAGLQTAFMAPTEILATQHARGLADLLEPMGIKVGLLVGSTKPKAKETVKTHIAAG
ncbi:MAG TPA: DEAD/DEAH box helicase, partial [Candidatus Saccharimonadales bacterium]|nr:DEAD/DEAH box helicase [Candidatus Saccharimonadales bacterium]